MKNVSFIGVQGSGKGTQAKLLQERMSYNHIDVGQLFRDEVKNKTSLGLKVKDIMASGKLIDDETVINLIYPYLKNTTKGNILDGFPRNLQQANYLLEKINIDYVFFLNLDDDTSINRINSRRTCSKCKFDYNLLHEKTNVDGYCDKCGGDLILRDDDKEEVIRTRLKEFHKNTKPLLNYFKSKRILHEIDASKSINEVNKEIVKLLT